jgi:GAF domain-containing protein
LAEKKPLSMKEAVEKVHKVAMSQSLNSLDELSDLVVEQAKRLVNADNGRLRFKDYTGLRLVPGTIKGALEKNPEMAVRKIGECIVGRVAEKKEMINEPKVQGNVDFILFYNEKVKETSGESKKYCEDLLQIGSEIAVPILAGDSLLGVLSVNSSRESAFSADHEHLLLDFASEVALSFLNRRALILTELHKIETKMISEYELRLVGQNTANGIQKMFKDCIPNIFLYNEHADNTINPFEFLTGAENNSSEFSQAEKTLGQIKPRYDPEGKKSGKGIEAINNFKEGRDHFVVVEDVLAKDSGASDSAIEKKVKTICCIPLTFKGTVVGILYLHFLNRRHFFTIEERTLLEMFAITAAFAIKNTATIKSAEKQPTYTALIGNGLINQISRFKPMENDQSPSLNMKIWVELAKVSTSLINARGEEEISELILNKVSELCDLLKLPPAFSKIFRNFMENEKILYNLPYYRDHFIHSFHVFYLGYLILNGWWNNKVPLVDGSSEEAKNRVLTTWFMASIFHDIAYPIEMTARWVPLFPKEVLGLDLEIKGSFDWTPIVLKKQNTIKLEKVSQLFFENANYDKEKMLLKNAALRNWILNQLLNSHDHGALSCIALLSIKCSKEHNECTYDAALAMLLHNYLKNRDPTIGSIFLNRYPLAYLLSYCDNAQEWGRAQNSPTEGLQKFVDHSVKFYGLEIDSNETIVTLEYNIIDRCKKKKDYIWEDLDEHSQLSCIDFEADRVRDSIEHLFAPLRIAWAIEGLHYRFYVKAKNEKGEQIGSAVDTASSM